MVGFLFPSHVNQLKRAEGVTLTEGVEVYLRRALFNHPARVDLNHD